MSYRSLAVKNWQEEPQELNLHKPLHKQKGGIQSKISQSAPSVELRQVIYTTPMHARHRDRSTKRDPHAAPSPSNLVDVSMENAEATDDREIPMLAPECYRATCRAESL